MTDTTSAYGPLDFARDSGVPRETLSRCSKYVDLLLEWNERLNLVAPSTLTDVWRRHMWDSAQLLPLIPPHARTIVDLGSGAGFPGMVLAICLSHPPPRAGEDDRAKRDPERGSLTVHLIDSTQKKCRFLEAVAEATGAPVKVHWARAEDLKGIKADVVTARAVAPLARLFPLAHPFFGPATIGLFLKGRSLNDELTLAAKSWRLDATPIPSRSDPSGFVLRVTGLTPWRRSRKPF
ncbi:MAG: 16S rRNA (guanine(527)-N(7))-methyltransferase RsmG [Alphaproteobacteria bacterium]|nr:16S rRNA (guanine(527)-N(7))-methyltransferase RsmG [Alphaproteobacteria bacterium]